MITGAATGSALAARAQQPAVPVLGILSDESPSLAAETVEPFAQGLRHLGYLVGQNIIFERRYADGKDESLPGLAAELIGLRPEAILAIGTAATRAAKSTTQTIPIVFARIADPVGLGLVASLARPGGNLTGVSLLTTDLAPKWLEFLITAVPDARRVGVLWDSSFPPPAPNSVKLEQPAEDGATHIALWEPRDA